MKKLIVYIPVFFIFLSVVFAADMVNLIGDYGPREVINYYCTTAKFCGDYELKCDYGSDDICPENYGGWSSCEDNNYGTKCDPCDSDCGVDCGILSLKVPDVKYNPDGAELINIEANAHGDYTGNYKFLLYKEGEDRWDYITSQTVSCNNGCSYTFKEVDVSGSPCSNYLYSFLVEFKLFGDDNSIDSTIDSGMISPYIKITNPNENDILQGNVDITSTVMCAEGTLFRVLYYLCQGEQCGRIALLTTNDQEREAQGTYIYKWDTTQSPNGNYNLTAQVVVRAHSKLADYIDPGVNIQLNNPLGISGNYQGSKILNIILARIKTWL